MKTYYYKIVYGYDEDKYISITQDELPKALALFIQGNGRAVFGNEAIRGQDIRLITEDWHTAMGWNKGYKMTPDEWADVKHLQAPYRDVLNDAKMIAEFSIRNNRPELLSQPLEESKTKLLGDGDEPKRLN